MALTTEQVLLLNNLMYMSNKSPLTSAEHSEGQSIGEWLSKVDVSQLNESKDYGSFMTGKDWQNIIQAVQNDDTLMNMTIATTHTDTAGGGGQSAIFVSESTGEAVVAFRGTAGDEWADNFIGGNVTDTPYQQNALEWYQSAYQENGLDGYEITITGHSKGGNKAKYITLLDSTVDHCVSFDGQGFSDEFMEKYADQIANRQDLIENHNVDYDFVNILLNDVGETTYYQGYDIGDGGFAENHCPNTFFNFDENGNFTIEVNPNGQGPEMQAMDEFLNNLIRSMPEKQQTETLECIGQLADYFFSSGDKSDMLNYIMDLCAEYPDEIAYVFAYVIEYEQANPEFVDQINSVLSQFGMEDFTQYVDMVDGILNFKKDYYVFGKRVFTVDFDMLYGLINGVAGIVPDGLWEWILGWIEDKYGIKLTLDQLKTLLKIAGTVYDDMQTIKIKDNGADIKIPSIGPIDSNVKPHGRLVIDLPRMRSASADLLSMANLLERAGTEMESVSGELRVSQHYGGTAVLRAKLLIEGQNITKLAERIRQLENALTVIAGKYESTESLIVSFL